MTPKQSVAMELLSALCESWDERFTRIDIGSDPEKVVLLRRAVALFEPGCDVPEHVRSLYLEVFLSDLWTDHDSFRSP